MINKNIKRILVPLDGSKNSFKGLDEAIYLAQHFNSAITALCVISSYPPLPLMGRQIPYEKHILEQVKRFMSNAKKTCVDNKVKFNEKIIKGIATLDTARAAVRWRRSGPARVRRVARKPARDRPCARPLRNT